MSAGRNFPSLQRRKDCTAFFLYMSTSRKPALLQIGRKFPERCRKVLLPAPLHLFRIKRGKSRCIRHNCSVFQPEQLYMPGRMPAAPQLIADRAYRKAKTWLQRIEDAGFAYTGVSCKGRYLSTYYLSQRIDSLPGLSADT